MSYKILLHLKAADFLNKMDRKKRNEIRTRLETLKEKPEAGKHSSFWSLRIRDYRAIYKIDREKNQVKVLFIGHRKDVYDDFSKLF